MILDYANTKAAEDVSYARRYNYAAADNQTVCTVLGRWTMFLDSRDVSITPHLAMRGIMDPHILEVLSAIVQPGMTCVEVGAGFGYYTLLLCELVKAQGRVYAFEPHPRVYPLLKKNIEINGFTKRTRPYPNAIGVEEGQGELATHRYRFDSATLSERAKASFGSPNTAGVHVSKLDDLLLEIRPEPDVYLISAVGYEPEVWAGMKGLLHAKRKLVILMETIHRWYANPAAFFNEILDAGFAVNRLHPDGSREPVLMLDQFTSQFKSWLLLTR